MSAPENIFSSYHAHVYFDERSVDQATALCQQAGQISGVQVGRVHCKPVGPHPRWSCQLAFDAALFEHIISWLDEHRQGLTILVHGVTGDGLKDHTVHASWLGEAVPLKLDMFRTGARTA